MVFWFKQVNFLSPSTAVLLQPQTPLCGRDGSLPKLHLSGFAPVQNKEPFEETLGALALLTSELTLRNFAQKQVSVPLAW